MRKESVLLKTICSLLLMSLTIISYMLIGLKGTILVVIAGGFVFKASGIKFKL